MPSKSKSQHNMMCAVAHNSKFAKKVGIPKEVGKEFCDADKGKKFKNVNEDVSNLMSAARSLGLKLSRTSLIDNPKPEGDYVLLRIRYRGDSISEYDWKELKQESYEKIKLITTEVESSYNVKIDWKTGEKNYIYFYIKEKNIGESNIIKEDTVYVSPKDPSVARLITAAFPGYNGQKCSIEVRNSVSVNDQWSGGSRTTTRFVNLETLKAGELPTSKNDKTPWDSAIYDGVELPPNVVAVSHIIFQGKDLGIRISVRSDNSAALIQNQSNDLTLAEKIVLVASRSLKSSYGGRNRMQMAQSSTGIPTVEYETAKQNLIAQGYLNAAGALTLKGKNAAGGDLYRLKWNHGNMIESLSEGYKKFKVNVRYKDGAEAQNQVFNIMASDTNEAIEVAEGRVKDKGYKVIRSNISESKIIKESFMSPLEKITSRIRNGEFGNSSPKIAPKEIQIAFRNAIRETFGHNTKDDNIKNIYNRSWFNSRDTWENLASEYQKITEQNAPETLFNGEAIMEEIINLTNNFMKQNTFLENTREVRREMLVKFIREQAKTLMTGKKGKSDIIESVLEHYESKYGVKLKQIIQEDDDDESLEDMLNSDTDTGHKKKEEDDSDDLGLDDDTSNDDSSSKRDDTATNSTEIGSDTITLDVPTIIRAFEYVRESIKTDVQLHRFVSNLIKLSKEKEVLTMDDYEAMIAEVKGSELEYLKKLSGIKNDN